MFICVPRNQKQSETSREQQFAWLLANYCTCSYKRLIINAHIVYTRTSYMNETYRGSNLGLSQGRDNDPLTIQNIGWFSPFGVIVGLISCHNSFPISKKDRGSHNMPFSIKLHKPLVLYLFHNDKCLIGLLGHVNTPCCYALIDNYWFCLPPWGNAVGCICCSTACSTLLCAD